MATAEGTPTVHYSRRSRLLAIAWIAVAVLLLIDLLLRGEGAQVATYGSVLLASVALVYLVWLRPRVAVTERGLRVVNPLRETFVPWSAVLWVDVVDVLRVHTPERIVRSWPLRETKRQRVRENLRRESGLADPEDDIEPEQMRPVELAAHQLRRDAERHKARPLSGPVKDVGEAGPAALGAQDRPQTMVPLEVIVLLTAAVVLPAAAFLLF